METENCPPSAVQLSVSSPQSQGTEAACPGPHLSAWWGFKQELFTTLTSCVETEVKKEAHRGRALAGQFLMTGFGLLHLRILV